MVEGEGGIGAGVEDTATIKVDMVTIKVDMETIKVVMETIKIMVDIQTGQEVEDVAEVGVIVVLVAMKGVLVAMKGVLGVMKGVVLVGMKEEVLVDMKEEVLEDMKGVLVVMKEAEVEGEEGMAVGEDGWAGAPGVLQTKHKSKVGDIFCFSYMHAFGL